MSFLKSMVEMPPSKSPSTTRLMLGTMGELRGRASPDGPVSRESRRIMRRRTSLEEDKKPFEAIPRHWGPGTLVFSALVCVEGGGERKCNMKCHMAAHIIMHQNLFWVMTASTQSTFNQYRGLGAELDYSKVQQNNDERGILFLSFFFHKKGQN